MPTKQLDLFILIKYTNKHVSSTLRTKVCKPISIVSTKYDYLWIGGNNLGQYEMDHYRGNSHYANKFKKSIVDILQYSKRKKLISYFSIKKLPSVYSSFTGSKVMIDETKIDEKPDLSSLKKKIKWKESTKVVKDLFHHFSVTKDKTIYYIPLLIECFHNDHPVKRSTFAVMVVDHNHIVLHTQNKLDLRQITLWVKRLLLLRSK